MFEVIQKTVSLLIICPPGSADNGPPWSISQSISAQILMITFKGRLSKMFFLILAAVGYFVKTFFRECNKNIYEKHHILWFCIWKTFQYIYEKQHIRLYQEQNEETRRNVLDLFPLLFLVFVQSTNLYQDGDKYSMSVLKQNIGTKNQKI